MRYPHLFVYYEHIEYISDSHGNLSERSRSVSRSPYIAVADLLKKHRMTRTGYEWHYENFQLSPYVRIRQHDLWYEHEGSVNFTIYWHPGAVRAPFHIHQFYTRVSPTPPMENIYFQNQAITMDQYLLMLMGNEEKLMAMIGDELLFLPVLVISAIRDDQHPLWEKGKASGRNLSL